MTGEVAVIEWPGSSPLVVAGATVKGDGVLETGAVTTVAATVTDGVGTASATATGAVLSGIAGAALDRGPVAG